MIVNNSPTIELFRLATIREVLDSPGPCMTVFLPPYRPGESAGSSAAILQAYLQDAKKQLNERGVSKPVVTNLLRPVEQAAENPSFEAGSHSSRAIFRSSQAFEQFHLTHPVDALWNVGGTFLIRPLASELARPSAFYILALSKEGVALHHCAGLHLEATHLPPGIPETLAEALALEPPDHDLESRSAAGSSTGAMRRVRFGTGSERERRHSHLSDYYKLVDRGIQQIVREQDLPLILAGPEEDVSIYRGAGSYRGLAKGAILGSPDVEREKTEILQRAYAILRTDQLEQQQAALMAAKEKVSSSRFSTDLDGILEAAFEGRVGQLYLNEQAQRVEEFARGNYQTWGKEDLLNLAAVQTILHHGKVCSLPGERMPDKSAAIAIFRF